MRLLSSIRHAREDGLCLSSSPSKVWKCTMRMKRYGWLLFYIHWPDESVFTWELQQCFFTSDLTCPPPLFLQTLLMAHALRRVSLSTARPVDAQFAFVSHNPGSTDAQLYCHVFEARHARAVRNVLKHCFFLFMTLLQTCSSNIKMLWILSYREMNLRCSKKWRVVENWIKVGRSWIQ